MLERSPVGGQAINPSTSEPKLVLDNVNFFYGQNHAVHDVNIQFPTGQVSALIGPSGCGKSTLLRVLNRIYMIYPKQRATGKVLLDGEDILDSRYPLGRLRARVGMVFQKPVPFPMSIYENVAYAIRHYERLSRREMNDRVEEALRQAALWDEVKNKLSASGLSLSGGSPTACS